MTLLLAFFMGSSTNHEAVSTKKVSTMTVYTWSQTASNDDKADSTINWQENQAPSTVNNSARAMMAALAKWRDDLGGVTATTGTSTAYALTSNQGFTSLTNGLQCGFYLHTSCGNTVTLNVDGLGAKPLRSASAVELTSGQLVIGGLYVATYILATTEWIVHGAAPPISGIALTAPEGRLTLTTGTPVLQTTTSGATTVYYTPYKGRFVPIYSGSAFVNTDIAGELSQATTDATKSPAACIASSNYDVFVWNDTGTIRATRGPVWNSNTARGTGAGTSELLLLNGIYVNKNNVANGPNANLGTYVGTIRTNASSQVDMNFGGAASGGSLVSLNVWNMYNRVLTTGTSKDSGATYTYSSGTWRAARASNNMRVAYVVGLFEDTVVGRFSVQITPALVNGASTVYVFGLNGITNATNDTTGSGYSYLYSQQGSTSVQLQGTQTGMWGPATPYATGTLGIGSNFIQLMEVGDGSNANTCNSAQQNQIGASLMM